MTKSQIAAITAAALVTVGGSYTVAYQAAEDAHASDVLHAADYGAVCDGQTNDTAALQLAIDAAREQGKPLQLPPGTCMVSDTLTIEDAAGFVLRGYGRLTVLWWERTADASIPLLYLADVRESRIEDFEVRTSSADGVTVELDTAIRVVTDDASPHASTANHFRDLYISGTNGAIGWGVDMGVGPGSAGNQNNEQHIFERVRVKNTSEAAFVLGHGNVKGVRFDSCACGRPGKACVRVVSGSFMWLHGSAHHSEVADFWVDAAGGPISIIGHDSENGQGLWRTAGPSGAASPVLIAQVRFMDNHMSDKHGCWVMHLTRGPVTIVGGVWGRPSQSPGNRGFCVAPGGSPAFASFTVQGALFATTGDPRFGDPWCVNNACQPFSQEGSGLVDPGPGYAQEWP